jgi:hypothetical protein
MKHISDKVATARCSEKNPRKLLLIVAADIKKGASLARTRYTGSNYISGITLCAECAIEK